MFKISKISNIIIFICFVISLTEQQNVLYQNVYLLPLVFLIFNIFFSISIEVLKKSFVFNFVMFQMIIRYAFVPMLISSGGFFSVGFISNSSSEAIFLMLFELLFVYMCFYYVSNKYTNSKTNKLDSFVFLKPNLLTMLILGITLFLIIQGGFFSTISVFWDFKDSLEKTIYEETYDVSSISGLLYPFFKGLVSVLLLAIIELYIRAKSIKFILLVVLLLLNLIFIVGVSRFSILFSILPITLLIIQLYPESKKKIFTVFLILFIPVLIISTLNKFTRGDVSVESKDVFNLDSYNAYFAGVGNVSVGLDAYYKINSPNHLEFFLSDLFQNVPVLSKMTNDGFKTNFAFNKEIYKHSYYQTQIVPLNVTGLFHMGLLGTPFYTFVFLLLAFYFERLSFTKNFVGLKYGYILLSFTCSSVFMSNVGAIFSKIVIGIIFILIPFYFLHKSQLIKRQ
jgi:hypothetical protein